MISNPKDAKHYLNAVIDKCNELQLDRNRIARVIRRRGFDTGEWQKITGPMSQAPRYQTKVYWEGECLGTIRTIASEALLSTESKEITLH